MDMFTSEENLWPQGHTPSPQFCDEDERLSVLAAYGTQGLLDDPELEQLVSFAADFCQTPVSTVTVVEEARQRFLARVGLEVSETPRSTSFCAHAMLEARPLIVCDATQDERFADNPLVTGDPKVRFYAGFPLVSEEGAPLGALCVIDTEPRPEGLTKLQHQGMTVLAAAVMRRFGQRRASETARSEIALREARLRRMIDSVPGIAWSGDDQGNLDYVNARWHEVTGAAVPLSASDWADLVHPDERENSLARWIAAMKEGKAHEDEIRLRHKDGEYRWVLSRALPVDEADGGKRWFGTVIDIDDAHRLSEARDLLANELAHRIKNIFAVVTGLIALHARGKPEVKPFADELNAAIRALSTAHDYVRADDARGVDDLKGLLKDLLAPYDGAKGERVAITGDEVRVGSRAATPLALIFHELATNAAKYGAFAHHDGKVSIEIRQPCEGEDRVCVAWRESSLHSKGKPEQEAEGFGSRLLRMAIEGQLSGRFTRAYSDDGLDVEISVPVSSLSG